MSGHAEGNSDASLPDGPTDAEAETQASDPSNTPDEDSDASLEWAPESLEWALMRDGAPPSGDAPNGPASPRTPAERTE